MAIESKDLIMWVKAMSRGQALPLDASEIYTSMVEAEDYASSPIAYAGQTIKVLQDDGKYHEYILQPSSSGYVLEEAGANDRLSEIESQIAELLYNPIVIKSFKNNGNVTTTLEKGASLEDVTLTWETDRHPKAVTISDNKGYSKSIDASSASFKVTNPVTEDITWTLTVIDEMDTEVSKLTNVRFCHGVYYGTIESGTDITGSAIKDLIDRNKLTKKLQDNKTVDKFSVNVGENEHIMFAIPTSYGKPVFKDYDRNFGAGFYKYNSDKPIKFMNSNDVTEDYDVWLSTNTGLGEMNIAVN